MARVKHTKNELKAQREALQRFERFLPMLQLKKQQLQAEAQELDAAIERITAAESALRAAMDRWVRLFSSPVDLEGLIRLASVKEEQANVAGVPLPVPKAVDIERRQLDLFETPSWLDDAQHALADLARMRIERAFLAEGRRRIMEELRTTTQRVNLFEKVKIPETRENIRVIRIFLGDQQTAGVARAKLAKRRLADYDESAAWHMPPEEASIA